MAVQQRLRQKRRCTSRKSLRKRCAGADRKRLSALDHNDAARRHAVHHLPPAGRIREDRPQRYAAKSQPCARRFRQNDHRPVRQVIPKAVAAVHQRLELRRALAAGDAYTHCTHIRRPSPDTNRVGRHDQRESCARAPRRAERAHRTGKRADRAAEESLAGQQQQRHAQAPCARCSRRHARRHGQPGAYRECTSHRLYRLCRYSAKQRRRSHARPAYRPPRYAQRHHEAQGIRQRVQPDPCHA